MEYSKDEEGRKKVGRGEEGECSKDEEGEKGR